MDRGQALSPHPQRELVRGQLQREQQSRHHRQGKLLHERRRLSDAGAQRPIAARPALLQPAAKIGLALRKSAMLRRGSLIVAVLMLMGCGIAARAQAPDKPGAAAPLPATIEYQRKLDAYTQARRKFDGEAAAYWGAVAQKRRLRNGKRREHQEIALDDYVLTQPPLYAGPPRPSPPLEEERREAAPRKYIPVVADFLKSAQDYFDFAPQRPRSEMEFKRAYAKLALEAGLTKEQIVRIYVFETGGNGTYDA